MQLLILYEGPAWTLWIQSLSWLGVFLTAIVAAFKFFSEQRHNREQRARELKQSELELRWKQASSGKALLDELLTDVNAQAAMRMLDWDDLEYEVTRGKLETISEADYLKALRTTNLNFSDKEKYIRNCFDSLFYFMAMFEHYTRSQLVALEDVAFPLDYYIRIMNRNRAVFENFLEHYHLQRSHEFIKRLDHQRG